MAVRPVAGVCVHAIADARLNVHLPTIAGNALFEGHPGIPFGASFSLSFAAEMLAFPANSWNAGLEAVNVAGSGETEESRGAERDLAPVTSGITESSISQIG